MDLLSALVLRLLGSSTLVRLQSTPIGVVLFMYSIVPSNQQVDWAEEQTARTDEFQKELQAKTEAMSDLNAEKVR